MNCQSGDPTASLCPHCLERIPARRVAEGDSVFLEKTCPVHGVFRARIWKGPPDLGRWHRPRIPLLAGGHTPRLKGCPFDCGLCPDHRQRSCTVLLEVTGRCDLGCPVCYAGAGPQGTDPSLDVIQGWFASVKQKAAGSNIQLSGGEPTLREDLPAIVAMGRDSGFPFIQLNTNGIRLGREPGYAAALKAAGLCSVFLQFDGIDDGVHRRLRGRPLAAEKEAAITACGKAGLGVVLVPTLVVGVNTGQVGAILDKALELAPAVRAVHFQPISFFGRFPHPPSDENRLTLPELLRLIETQTGGRFPVSGFKPPGCEHSLCSFHGQFLPLADGRIMPLATDFCQDGCLPIDARQGALKAIAGVARQWAGASPERCPEPTPRPLAQVEQNAGPMDLDVFVELARKQAFAVSAMAFQDVWNLDLERVRECCIHVHTPDGRLVPFCLYNLTAANGQALYRPRPPLLDGSGAAVGGGATTQ